MRIYKSANKMTKVRLSLPIIMYTIEKYVQKVCRTYLHTEIYAQSHYVNYKIIEDISFKFWLMRCMARKITIM